MGTLKDKRSPHQRLLEEKKREALTGLSRSVSDAGAAASIAEQMGEEDLATRIRESASRLDSLYQEFRRIQVVSDVADDEPFEAPLEKMNDRCWVGDLWLEWGVVVDLKLPDGRYVRTTSDTETCAGHVSKSAMHLNFPVLSSGPERTVEVRLPVPHGAIARWVRELTSEERAKGRRPLLAVAPADPPGDAKPLKLDHDKRFHEKDLVGGKALIEGEPIEVFLADGRALGGTWDTDRSPYGHRIRVGLLKFGVAAKSEHNRAVHLPLVEDGILVRRKV